MLSIDINRIILLIFILGYQSHSFAYLDPLDEKMRAQYQELVSWHNIHDVPHWRGGQKPECDNEEDTSKKHQEPGENSYWVGLQPGQYTLIHLSRNSRLKILAPPGSGFEQLVIIQESNGTGLYRQIEQLSKGDSNELLIPESHRNERLIKISNSDSSQMIRIALFHSVREQVKSLAPYRSLLSSEENGLRLRTEYANENLSFIALNPADVFKTKIIGPVRIKLQSHLDYQNKSVFDSGTYHLQWRLNNQDWQDIAFNTHLVSNEKFFLEQRLTALGERQDYYFFVPEGEHEFSLKASEKNYFRLLGLDNPDYLFTEMNKPILAHHEIAEEKLALPKNWLKNYSSNENGLLLAFQAEEMVNRIKLNTEYREVEMTAADLFFANLKDTSWYLPALSEAERFLKQNSFYRQLIPAEFVESAPYPDQIRSYLQYELQDKEQKQALTEFVEPMFSQSCRQLKLQQARFNYIAKGRSQRREYYVPQRGVNSRLRIDVNQDSLTAAAKIYLQFDDYQPILLKTLMSKELELSDYRISNNEACLSNSVDSNRLLLYPLANIAYFEIPLPAHVKKISVWQDDSTQINSDKLYLSLKYRTSKQYRIDPHLLVQILKQYGSEPLFKNFISFVLGKPDKIKLMENQNAYLRRYWLDLKRFLLSQKTDFFPKFNSYESARLGTAHLTNILANDDLSGWQIRILKAEILNQYSPSRADKAARKLFGHYQKHGMSLDEFRLQVVLALQKKDSLSFKQLMPYLKENGYYRFAWEMGLLISDKQEEIEALAELAVIEKQWPILDFISTRLNNPSVVNLWRGFAAQGQGNPEQAKMFWSEAGAEGLALINHNNKIPEIIKLLSSSEKAERLQGLKRWQQWRHGITRLKYYRSVEKSVLNYTGSASLYNLRRDLYKRYFVAKPSRPIKLQLFGPAKLKFEARVLHRQPRNHKDTELTRQNDWLTINDNGVDFITPIINSVPSHSLQVIEQQDATVTVQAGTQNIRYFELDEGSHELNIYPSNHHTFLSISQESSAIEPVMLPDVLQSELMTHIIHGNLPKPELTTSPIPEEFSCHDNTCIRVSNSDVDENVPPNMTDWLPRVEKILSTPVSSGLEDNLTSIKGTQNKEQKVVNHDFIINRDQSFAVFKELILSFCTQPSLVKVNPQYVDINVKVEALDEQINSGVENNQVLNRCLLSNREMLYPILINIYRRYEKYPKEREYLLSLTENIERNNIIPSKYRVLLRNITARAKWSTEPNVLHSAGIRILPEVGWQPSSESGRLMKHLLNLNDNQAVVINDNNISGIQLFVEQRSDLYLILSKNNLPYQSPFPVSFRYQANDGQWNTVDIIPSNNKKRIKIPLAPGEHFLRFQWMNPALNEFLSLQLLLDEYGKKTYIVGEKTLNFHVATHDEPVDFYVEGPTSIRLDYIDKRQKKQLYLEINEGLSFIKIKPPKNSEEILTRIYKRTLDESKSIKMGRLRQVAIENIPFHSYRSETMHSTASERYKQVKYGDYTWSLYAEWINGVDEEIQLDEQIDNEFFEAGVEFYKHLPGWGDTQHDVFYFGAGLIRNHRQGNPSYGTKHTLYYQSDWFDTAFKINWKGYAQKQDATSNWAWSSNLRLNGEKNIKISEKAYHKPQLEFFYKHFHHDTREKLELNKIDPDVWNEYGEEHYTGINLGDTFYYKPWLDTQFRLALKLYSDENYRLHRPEHGRVSLGWKQLLGPAIVDLRYDWKYYFAYSDKRWGRSEDFSDSSIRFSLEWENWFVNKNRFLLKIGSKYHINKHEFDFNIGLHWHFDERRGFKDFRPGSISFRNLRERQRFIGEY